MKLKNIYLSGCLDEPGYCVYCDLCGAYIFTSEKDPINFPDALCVNCDDEKLYIDNGGFLGGGI